MPMSLEESRSARPIAGKLKFTFKENPVTSESLIPGKLLVMHLYLLARC